MFKLTGLINSYWYSTTDGQKDCTNSTLSKNLMPKECYGISITLSDAPSSIFCDFSKVSNKPSNAELIKLIGEFFLGLKGEYGGGF
jgi:hypothetical protein